MSTKLCLSGPKHLPSMHPGQNIAYVFYLIKTYEWHSLTLLRYISGAQLFSLNPWEISWSPADIGAGSLKPLFIAGSVVTTIFLDLSFASERLLRHNGRLVRNYEKTEKILSAFASSYTTPPSQVDRRWRPQSYSPLQAPVAWSCSRYLIHFVIIRCTMAFSCSSCSWYISQH